VAIPILGDVIREVGGVVRELVPDADKRMELEVRLAELADRADAREDALLQSQVEVNKIEAGSANLFVAGWRPFVGWGSGVAFLYSVVVGPLLNLRTVDMDQIYPVLFAMLGVGAMRTYEKTKGVATSLGGKIHVPVDKLPG
jgi:hypothetical protein